MLKTKIYILKIAEVQSNNSKKRFYNFKERKSKFIRIHK